MRASRRSVRGGVGMQLAMVLVWAAACNHQPVAPVAPPERRCPRLAVVCPSPACESPATGRRHGELLWEARAVAKGWVSAKAVAVSAGGDVVVGGSYSGTVDFGDGVLAASDWSHRDDVFVAGYRADGRLRFSRRLPASELALLAVDRVGDVFVVARARAADVTTTLGANAPALRTGATVLLALDASGALRWARHLGPYRARVEAIAITEAGDVVLAGNDWAAMTFGEGPVDARRVDSYVTMYRDDGVLLWSRGFGADQLQRLTSLAITPHAILAAGAFRGVLGLPAGSSTARDLDGFVLAFDCHGEVRWFERLGGPEDQSVTQAVVDSSGRAAVLWTSEAAAAATWLGELDEDGAMPWARRIDRPGILAAGTEGTILHLVLPVEATQQRPPGAERLTAFSHDGAHAWSTGIPVPAGTVTAMATSLAGQPVVFGVDTAGGQRALYVAKLAP